MEQKVLKAIYKYGLLKAGEKVIVGLSGGPDSVCLLHVLSRIRGTLGIDLYAVHINHMLRGKESDGDQEYAERLCSELGVVFYARSCDIKGMSKEMGISLEEAGREIRYRVFGETARMLGGAKIAVAHNKNDQAETVLMHIIRGTGIDGLKGMEHKRGHIIRPLLDVSRNEIEEYCRENSLLPRTDSTNKEPVYTRNKIRLELIPQMEKDFNPGIVDSIYKMSMLIRDDYEFLEQAAEGLYSSCVFEKKPKMVSLKLSIIKDFKPGPIKRILRKAIKDVKGNLKGIERSHIEAAANLVQEGRTGAVIQLPKGIRVFRTYDLLKIYVEDSIKKEDYEECFEQSLSIPGETRIGDMLFAVKAEIIPDFDYASQPVQASDASFVQYFDYNSFKKGINLRNRRNGDVFKPLNSRGSKKLKEYFIDNKIPKDIRDKIPLIAENNEIVWIIGYKASDRYKAGENTRSALKLEFIEL